MKVVTAEKMRRIDEITIRERGTPGAVLMDRAGLAVAREAIDQFEPDSVLIVTGKGNNAGDGFVAARELNRQQIRTVLALLVPPEELSGDALEAYHKVPDEVCRLTQPGLETLREEFTRHDLVIDAIFGTGMRGPVTPPWSETIEAINASGLNVLSVDIPSGLPADRAPNLGAPELGPHVRATMTVTIGLPKLGMIVDPGVHSTGSVVVADIGFPRDLLEDPALTVNLMTLESARAMLPKRKPGGHKGTFGKLIVLGGSEGMTGAAILTARAAMRSGVGLVYSCYPRALGAIIESNLIEPVKIPLAGQEGWFTGAMAEETIRHAEEMDAVALGPGIGMRTTTGEFVSRIIAEVNVPMVLDASGLDLLAKDLQSLKQRLGPIVLTPHPKEASRLLGCTVEEIENNRLDAFVEFARKYEAVVVLKGSQTVVTGPDGQRYINPTGNSGLAKGGSGDVLTGLIGGLLAQGCPALDAARLGVFLHGMAADVTAERISVRAMIPSDVVDALGVTYLRLEKKSHEGAR